MVPAPSITATWDAPPLNAAQQVLVAALAASGRPGDQVSSTDLAKATGLSRTVVRRELAELRATLGLGQWGDIAATARERGLIVTAASAGPTPQPATVADLTAGEAALLRAISASPGATSTGWATELGVSSSRVRQLLGSLREKCGVPTTEALVALARDGPVIRDG